MATTNEKEVNISECALMNKRAAHSHQQMAFCPKAITGALISPTHKRAEGRAPV
jgi:hypothetical protein